jgi:hypothetical protein
VLASELPPKPKGLTKRRKTALTQENYNSAKTYQSSLKFTTKAKKRAAKLAKDKKRQADATRLAYQSSDVASSSSDSDDRDTINILHSIYVLLPLRVLSSHLRRTLPDIFLTQFPRVFPTPLAT